jgi:hypothetical protein
MKELFTGYRTDIVNNLVDGKTKQIYLSQLTGFNDVLNLVSTMSKITTEEKIRIINFVNQFYSYIDDMNFLKKYETYSKGSIMVKLFPSDISDFEMGMEIESNLLTDKIFQVAGDINTTKKLEIPIGEILILAHTFTVDKVSNGFVSTQSISSVTDIKTLITNILSKKDESSLSLIKYLYDDIKTGSKGVLIGWIKKIVDHIDKTFNTLEYLQTKLTSIEQEPIFYNLLNNANMLENFYTLNQKIYNHANIIRLFLNSAEKVITNNSVSFKPVYNKPLVSAKFSITPALWYYLITTDQTLYNLLKKTEQIQPLLQTTIYKVVNAFDKVITIALENENKIRMLMNNPSKPTAINSDLLTTLVNFKI